MNTKFCLIVAGLALIFRFYPSQETSFVSPVPSFVSPVPLYVIIPTPTATPTPKNTHQDSSNRISGLASYYSVEGCLGCRDDLLMANGEPLDDDGITIAFNHAKLNSMVKITNVLNGYSVLAKVTDTGGFERHGRIADLTVGTKNALNCSDLCQILIDLNTE